jgi:hypothetical protein
MFALVGLADMTQIIRGVRKWSPRRTSETAGTPAIG